MKIKVYNPVDEVDKKRPLLEHDDLNELLRVRLTVNDEVFELTGGGGLLALRSISGKQLVVRPRASNMIEFDVVPWQTESSLPEYGSRKRTPSRAPRAKRRSRD
jgi:hypothetical protein